MILHLFNPSHDEALASGSPYYTPTRAARELMTDLACIPARWAGEGDAVLLWDEKSPCPPVPGINYVYFADISAAFWERVSEVRPWGWDAHVCHRLRRMGAPDRLLPDADRLARWRDLSSRRTTVRLLPRLRHLLPSSVGEARWCCDVATLCETVDEWGRVMVKAPWSCSGRGVFPLAADSPESAHRRAARILREQGAVEVEPLYHRLVDFAIEWHVDAPGLPPRYEGLSLFLTDSGGRYGGNLVLPETELAALLPVEARTALPALRAAYVQLLPPLLDDYVGPLGVDMMVVRGADGLPAVHPCVEVNLRHTMGRVAVDLMKRES